MKHRGAFTLIELLIVVAIIGILAAIAIPNFLQAQTRAKVARSAADIRTLALAYETYSVDNNWIPWDGGLIDRGYCGMLEYVRWLDAATGIEMGIGERLTTPIDYLSSIPRDPFNSKAAVNQNPHNFPFEVVWASVFVRSAPTAAGMDSICTFTWLHPDGGVISYRYIFESIGPDLSPWTGFGSPYYDPTNGTISAGDIIYIDNGGFLSGGLR